MPRPIAVFYHCFLFNGEPPELRLPALNIVREQMNRLEQSGLVAAASEIIIGLNGGEESMQVGGLFMPAKAQIVLHGLESKCENLTLVEIEKWLPGHQDWNVLYFHAKGSGHDPASDYGKFDGRWRECLMTWCVDNWRLCVSDLDRYEAVGCHWLTRQGYDHSQNYFAGTFFWARAAFLLTLPSIYQRERIKMSGIASRESRYEAEVWIGNGARLPTVRDYHPGTIDH